MADSAAINSPDYWNHRFAVDWTARGGGEQTSFFSRLAITMLPDWFWDDAAENALSFVDVGCALGEALPDFNARLPNSKLTGIDVSKVAVQMASERLPQFSFRAVSEDWSDAPTGDIMFCSNTLEHLKDWRRRLARLGELAEKYVLMLVPFQEWAPIDEHVVTFDFTSFPEALPDGKRLLYLRITDAARSPDTHWNGHQALAIYGSKAKVRGVSGRASLDPYAGIDFRGRTPPQVRASLIGLQAAYPGAPQPSNDVNATQALVDRINTEWREKLDASVAEMAAKHEELRTHYERVLSERDAKLESSVSDLEAKQAELRTHYERVLGERDAKIGQLSELQAWRKRAQELEESLRDGLIQQLRRNEEDSKSIAEQLVQTRLDAERLRAHNMHVEKLAADQLVQARLEADSIRAHYAQIEAVSQRVAALETEQNRQDHIRSQQTNDALHAELSRRDAEIADLRNEVMNARPLKMQVALLEKELTNQIAALLAWPERHEAQRAEFDAAKAFLERQISIAAQETEQLNQSVASRSATIAALKATLRNVVVERNAARVNVDRLALALQSATAKPFVDDADAMLERIVLLGEEKSSHEANVVRTREHYEAHIAGLIAELQHMREISTAHERNVETLKDHYEEYIHSLVEELKAAPKSDERDFVRAKEQELYINALRNDVERLSALSAAHDANVLRTRAHYETHLRGLNGRLASVSGEMREALEAVRLGWRAELASAQLRATEQQNYASVLRAQLEQVLGSKSFALAHKARRVFWLLRGVANPGLVRIAPPPAERQGATGEFLKHWDRARTTFDALVDDDNFAGASADFTVPPSPPVSPSPLTAPAHAAPKVVVAMQVASLANGGLERVVLDLCMGLLQRGVKVLVIAVSAGGPLADQLRQNGVSVHEIDANLDAYTQCLATEGVTDLMLHHSYFGLERASQSGVRVYDVVHNYYFWHRGNPRLMERVAEHCARVIYVSSSVRRFHEMLFKIPHEKGVVINNPAHLEGLIIPEKAQLRRLRERREEAVFLNVAQAFPAKAQAAMITAFARALRRNQHMRLQIAGASVKPEVTEAVAKRIAEEGVADSVDLLGHCDRRKMSRLYAEAHAFVLPSLYEGYSVSALEAASYALPLILTDVGGAADLLDDRGCGIVLPAPIPDFSALEPREIEQLGLASENDATAALAQAFCDIASDRNTWIERGLRAQFNMVSLDEATDQYLALIDASASATLRV